MSRTRVTSHPRPIMTLLRTPKPSEVKGRPLSGTHRASPQAFGGLPPFSLCVLSGAPPRRNIVWTDERLVIGRTPPADLSLDDASVSQPHCEIVGENDAWLIKDLGSQTGTRIAGVRVLGAYLPCETRIVIGRVELAFQMMWGDAGETALAGLVGSSEVMRAAIDRLSRVAGRDTTVLLEGESGTGKRLAAELVHAASSRKSGPFVQVDCRREPSLLEIELFGQNPPAAPARSEGAFIRASGGTLFLDEVGELGLDLQRRVLRVLEQREVGPEGSTHRAVVDVRIIRSTSRDLYREMGRGAFRDDLYYGLAVATIRLPPLRERLSDVPVLVRHFLHEHALKDGVDYSIDDAALERLALRGWPGNVRELRNVVETMLAF